MEVYEWLELGIQILLFLFVLYLTFFKSYLNEKGKNVALKEDVEILTREVENVKNEFVKEQEFLKFNLQRMMSNEVAYRNEEREIIINFYTIMSKWKFSILEIRLYLYDKTNIETLKKDMAEIDRYYAKAGVALDKVRLLIEDKNLINSANALHMSILNYYHWSLNRITMYKHNIQSQSSLTERFLIILKVLDQNKEEGLRMAEKEKELINEQNNQQEDYLKDRTVEVGKTNNFSIEFRDLVKKYLKA